MIRLIHIVSLNFVIAAAAYAQGPIATCEGVTEAKTKSRVLLEGKTLMTHLLMLEGRGEALFHATYPEPASQCVFEEFDAAGSGIRAVYSPLEKAPVSLIWKFLAGDSDPREILVLYDGTASFIAKKDVFLVVEERKGAISFYAMFRDPPALAVLKPLVTEIVAGSAAPLAVVRWPPGAPEPVIDAYSSKLK